ncbi:hypothetical protein D3C85_1258930 [compost metagenome]
MGDGAIQPARVQRRHGEGEVDRETHVTEVEQGWMDDEADVLQHGVEIASLQRPRELPIERAGEGEGVEAEQPDDEPHDGQHPHADQRIDPRRAERHQGAPERQRKHEEQHGALVAAPHGRELEAHGQGAVGVLGHIHQGEVVLTKADGEQPQRRPEQGGIEQRQRFGAAEQRARGEPQPQPGQGALHQRQRRRQQQ